jgi:hypothetical protein
MTKTGVIISIRSIITQAGVRTGVILLTRANRKIRKYIGSRNTMFNETNIIQSYSNSL